MATTESAAKRLHAVTTSTTAETWSLSGKVNKVDVVNGEAAGGESVYVTLAIKSTAALAEAAIVTAVANGDETFVVLPQQTVTIWDRASGDTAFVAGSIIGNASPYSIIGFD